MFSLVNVNPSTCKVPINCLKQCYFVLNTFEVNDQPSAVPSLSFYLIEQIRTENMKRAFSISGAMIWNSIPLAIN